MSRSWLTETIAQVDDLLNQINGLPDEVRLYLIDRLIPEPEPEVKPAKKTRKKSSKLSAVRCQAELVSGATCNMTRSHGIHDPAQASNYVESHKFISNKSASKSSHAQSLSGVIQRAPKVRMDGDDEDDGFCRAGILGSNAVCGLQLGHNVHQMKTYKDYHPFVSASDAASAGEGSSTNGETTSITASSEMAKEDVSNVHHAGG